MPRSKFKSARTKVQRARNWALRKAEELIKVEANSRSISGLVRIHFEMPIRKVLVGEAVVFQQLRNELRGEFVGEFSVLALPL